MTREEFEKIIAEEFLAVPEKFRRRMKNVVFLVEDEPLPETRKEEGLSDEETLFGLYTGVPATERGNFYGMGPTMPDTITIFKRPIEEESDGDEEEIRRYVRETVFHEVAHYLGMDEEEVASWEMKNK